VLKDGKLVLDPISGTLPAGKMSGRLTIDANLPKPPVALVLPAPGLSLRALALMLGLPSTRRARSKWTPISMAPEIACT
jgi:hypothetical protein